MSYLVAVGGNPNPNDLFVIWIGANDFLAGINGNTTSAVIGAEITVLSLAGAHQFLVINVPDISLTPNIIAMGTGKALAAKQFVATVDCDLQAEIPNLASLYGVKIDLIDVNTLFTELVNDPAAFGFKNSTGEAYNPNTGVEVKNPNQYVFWDGFHPTTRVHRLAAADVMQLGANP